ncbi:MAG: hypothetical protein HUM72_12470 [Dolichospermum sp.]|nr:hypothetical protein [Dolichospermum sp.]
MSKISTVYSALISSIEDSFGGKTRLHNPYQLDENPDIVRKDAWGIKVLEATLEDIEYCNLSLNRSFSVVFLRQFISLSGKEDGFDNVTVLILEDQEKLSQILFSPNEIDLESIIDKIDITNISGIQELTTGEKRYLFGEVTFNILISELIK